MIIKAKLSEAGDVVCSFRMIRQSDYLIRKLHSPSLKNVLRKNNNLFRHTCVHVAMHSNSDDTSFIFPHRIKSFVKLCKISRSITARISRPVIKKCRVSLGKDESQETNVRREDRRRLLTQSNTARLIRRKLRGCLPLFINFNSARGPPTKGVPPLATSVRGPSVKRGAGLSLRSSLRTERLPRKIAINRCQADDPKIQQLVRDKQTSKIRILLQIYFTNIKRVTLSKIKQTNTKYDA